MINQSVFFLSLIFFCYISCVITGRTVKLINGTVKGFEMKTRNGRSITAFLSLRYAHPPVGYRRFKEPAFYNKSWQNITLLNKEGSCCSQKINNTIKGNEDCLTLNIFTPFNKFHKIKDQHLLPVMIWIHGGQFVKGCATSAVYGPQYLLDRDILLVTINYRLGIFGFITTGDAASPGNLGLKDQVLALKWLRDNINVFGGDPNRFTLFGSEAGGVSINLHALSESTKGLFHQYIMHSGNVFVPWAYKDSKKFEPIVKKVSENLGCKNNKSEDLIKCLQSKTAVEIVEKTSSKNIAESFTKLHWLPTNESNSLNAYLTDNPLKLIENNEMKDYPFIIGNVHDDGTLFSQNLHLNSLDIFKLRRMVDVFINDTARYHADFRNNTNYREAVLNYYFNNSLFSMEKDKLLHGYGKFVSDIYFLYPTTKFLQTFSSKALNPFYVYSFGYQGKITNALLTKKISKNIGIGHKDELLYLFPMVPNRTIEKEDESLIDIMVDLWTSFAIDGKPTTEFVDDPDFWEPYTQSNSYLHITKDPDLSLNLDHDFSADRMEFLKAIAIQT